MRSLASLALVSLALCAGSVSVAATTGGQFSRIRSLARFFDIVLDKDHDGRMSQMEYKQHLEGMDPESAPTLPLHYTNKRHGELDANSDKYVHFEELCIGLGVCDESEVEPVRLAEILRANQTAPCQVHLAATATYDEMVVGWAHNITDQANSEVQYGTVSGAYTNKAAATWQTYTVSRSGLTYTSLPLFNASMTGLLPSTMYYYRVGSEFDGFSNEFSFTSFPDTNIPAAKQNTTRMVVYGDQGVAMPMGAVVCQWVEEEHKANPFGSLLHVGDLAYAGVSHSMGEYEPTWDAWMEQISGLSSAMPYQVSVGNHEDFFNFASYDARFNMPGEETGGNASFWFSYDQGPVHVTSFSTESPYSVGSVQYQWIEADMAKARANPNTKWLLLSGHRALYSSDSDEWNDHQPGCPLLKALEPLALKYQVDLVLTGHFHMYERTFPVNNGTVVANGTVTGACTGQKDHELGFMNEKAAFWSQVDDSIPLQVYDRDAAETAPIYIVQATAGVFQIERLINPQPAWSNVRIVGTWGYGVLSVSTTSSGCSTLLYQFKTEKAAVVDQFALTKMVDPAVKERKVVRDENETAME